MCLNFTGNLIKERFLMDKFPLTMIVSVKFEKIVVEKSEKKKVQN